MFNLIPICALVIVLFKGVYSRQCNNCIKYDHCPEVVHLLRYEKTVENIKLLRDASCGFDVSGRTPVQKVCCSAFSNANNDKEIQETSEDKRIANHRNLKLLAGNCGHIKGDRIFGGKIADLYEFPWMALVGFQTRFGLSYKCGGSIINKRYVLTAAHCVKNIVYVEVRLGEYDLGTEIDCQKNTCERHIQDILVDKIIIHENYQAIPSTINDIALLRLAEDIDFDHKNINRICLPTTSQLRRRDLGNEIVTVTGWGVTESRSESLVLRKVNLTVHTAQNCSDLYARYNQPLVNTDQLCAGSQNKDSCYGDSGGPMMLEEKYNNIYKYVQYGIVSHGIPNCGSNLPTLYTDVTKFMGWILDNMSP